MKLHWIIYGMIIYAKLIDCESLTMNSIYKSCSRTLSKFIYQICTGDIPVSGLPSSSLSKVRGKRASLFVTQERFRRQLADECCSQPCSITQILEYCPENW